MLPEKGEMAQDMEYRRGRSKATETSKNRRRGEKRDQETDIRYSRTASKISKNSEKPSLTARKN